MVRIGYHASHEQFTPRELLGWVGLAEQAGFDCAKCSDHFHPWSERQGQSGFAWTWLGAAMQATRLPMGIISAPGYRYHPAIIAQAAATTAQMFRERLWLSLGSGEAVNEYITGLPWPEKPERNALLLESVEVIRRLFAGETVTHRGRFTLIEAKLYSRPERPVPIYGAAMSEATAEWAGSWADGLLTTGGDPDSVRKVVEAFRRGGGAGKPVVLQLALCWAETEDEAVKQALDQWSSASIGGEVNWDLRRPKDFDMATRFVGPEHIAESVHVSADLGKQIAWMNELAALEVDELQLHQVGRNQREFIETFGAKVLPKLR